MDTDALVRNIGNVANASTPLGLIVALAGGGRLRLIHGLVVADRVSLPAVTASAVTIGSVVLVPGRSLEQASTRIPGLLEHENHHAYQWAYCFGVPFAPLYAAAAAWSWLRSGNRASANVFERQAGLSLGGYPASPLRSAPAGLLALCRVLSGAVAQRSGRPAAATAADAVA